MGAIAAVNRLQFRYVSRLRLGLAGGRPIKAVLADARDGKPLSADKWRLLAFYSWGTDDGQLAP